MEILTFELMCINIIFELGKRKNRNQKGNRMPENRERKVTDLDKKLLRIDP